MKKEIVRSGLNGTFKGSVEIRFKYRTEPIQVHNPSTHDEDQKFISYNCITGYIGGVKAEFIEYRNIEHTLVLAAEIENKITIELTRLAVKIGTDSIEDRLKRLGYY